MSVPRLPRRSRGGSGQSKPPPHPLARAIEQLYAAGATPRLVIDARRADVIVPDHVRTKWAEKLVIDLDAAYPLDLAYDTDGVHASLAFAGLVTRCTFSWSAIYRVLDRATGRGIVIPAHEPPETLPPELVHEPAPAVTEVVEAKSAPKASLSVAPPPPSDEPTTSAPPSAASTASSVSDEEAKARRAKFRVIEGG